LGIDDNDRSSATLDAADGGKYDFRAPRGGQAIMSTVTRRVQNRSGSEIQMEGSQMVSIDPLTATAVVVATAATDAVYVMFTSAVVARRRVPAASWSSVWYLLSSYAVISYTENWAYVAFAAAGSWIGAFASITFLHRPGRPPVGAGPE
jgi:hypothetical protein